MSQQLNAPLRRACRALRGKRLFVLDDYHRDLEYASGVLRTLPNGDRTRVTVESNPRLAAETIVSAAKRNEPFDALVLDLAMSDPLTKKRHNGDTVLREVAKELRKARLPLPPVAFFSGEHAAGIQAFVAHEGERAKRERSVQRDAWPVTLVLKSETSDALIRALDMVLQIHKERGGELYQRFVERKLRLSPLELDNASEQISKIARLVHHLSSAGEEIDKFLTKYARWYVNSKYQSRQRGWVLEGLCGYYRFDHIAGDSELAAFRRHSLAGWLGGASTAGHALAMQAEKVLKHAAGAEKRSAQRVSEVLGRYRDFLGGVLQEFHLCNTLRQVRISTVDLTAILNGIRNDRGSIAEAVEFEVPNRTLMVKGPLQTTFCGILEQPIENAVKFNDRSRGAVRVTLQETELEKLPTDIGDELKSEFPTLTKGGPLAHVCVRDYGPGIPPEKIKQIFEPDVSFRVDGAPTSTGWGLYTLAEYMRGLSGGYVVRSQNSGVNRGTEFHLFFKLEKPDAGA